MALHMELIEYGGAINSTGSINFTFFKTPWVNSTFGTMNQVSWNKSKAKHLNFTFI